MSTMVPGMEAGETFPLTLGYPHLSVGRGRAQPNARPGDVRSELVGTDLQVCPKPHEPPQRALGPGLLLVPHPLIRSPYPLTDPTLPPPPGTAAPSRTAPRTTPSAPPPASSADARRTAPRPERPGPPAARPG